MKEQSEPLETLSEIRSMMERSTRFISLNGLSGVFAGIFALVGAFVAYVYLKNGLNFGSLYYENSVTEAGKPNLAFYTFLFTDAFLVLFASLTVAVYLSVRKARKNGLKIWDHSAKRLFINMMIPLFTGGFFCLALIYHGKVGFVAPASLVFYGLALVNSSKYTINDIRYLGLSEIVIGLLASIWIGYGLLFWAIGFGVLHIIYGTAMYFKYER
jgi:hypothetical protein